MTAAASSDTDKMSLSLLSKVDIAKIVIRDALGKFSRPAVVWSAGKDSTTVLHIVKVVCSSDKLNLPPCLFIDHGDHFEETMELVNALKKDWGLNIISASNADVLNSIDKEGKIHISNLSENNRKEAERVGFTGEWFEYSLSSAIGNHLLKTVPMNETMTKYRLDALFTGIRWDENPSRAAERFISYRENPSHSRVQPILPFTERDIWGYIFQSGIPYHPLYSKGYRSIDGKMDSKKSADEPAWEQDMEHTHERAGRSQNKEEMMGKLRQLGYM